MWLTQEETREWFQMRDHVRQSVMQLEVCDHCSRVRDRAHLIRVAGTYYCRPDDEEGCPVFEGTSRARLQMR